MKGKRVRALVGVDELISRDVGEADVRIPARGRLAQRQRIASGSCQPRVDLQRKKEKK